MQRERIKKIIQVRIFGSTVILSLFLCGLFLYPIDAFATPHYVGGGNDGSASASSETEPGGSNDDSPAYLDFFCDEGGASGSIGVPDLYPGVDATPSAVICVKDAQGYTVQFP